MSKLIDNLSGHAHIKSCLNRLLESREKPQALLFKGPRGVGKSIFATTFAKELIKESSPFDLHHFHPEGKNLLHPIDSIKQCIQTTRLPPFEGNRKVVILHDAERMAPPSANALLKTLEEPLPHSTIILISSHPESLLSTIASRCFSLSFSQLLDEEIARYLQKEKNQSEETARQLALLSSGLLSKADALADAEHLDLPHLIAEMGTYALYQDHFALSEALGKLEAFLEQESPIPHVKRVEDILFFLFYWYRDLHLMKIEEGSSLIFFQEQKKMLKSCLACPLLSLEKIQKKIEKIREALELNVNFSHAIAIFFLHNPRFNRDGYILCLQKKNLGDKSPAVLKCFAILTLICDFLF